MSSCELTLESSVKPRNSVVSWGQSISTIISAVDNLYSIEPDIVKDPNLFVAQETSSSRSEGSSVEEYPTFYAILLPSPWEPVINDSSSYVVREDKPIIIYGGNLMVAVYTRNQCTTMTIWKQ